MSEQAPTDQGEVAVIVATVTSRLANTTLEINTRLLAERRGLHFLSPQQFQLYTDAVRALDALLAELRR